MTSGLTCLPHTVLGLLQINHDALLALLARFVAEPAPHHKVAPVDLAELYKCLPPNKVSAALGARLL